jgi:hypothetical protein
MLGRKPLSLRNHSSSESTRNAQVIGSSPIVGFTFVSWNHPKPATDFARMIISH